MILFRLKALIIKEILTLVRDPRNRIVLIVPPLAQLLVFSFASTLEVKNNSLAIWNQDNGAHAAELIQRFQQMGAFAEVQFVHDRKAFDQSIDRQHALVAVRIPSDFSAQLRRNDSPAIQVIGDGRRSNSGQIALAYLNEVVRDFNATLNPERPLPGTVTRHWFNPNLHYMWFIVPSLVAILTTVMAMVITALSVARERELGTFDQLMVSPLTPAYILAGKAIPAFLITMLEASAIIAIGVFLIGVPFTGSITLLYLTMAAYILALVGVGLFISSLCATQQQAILGVFGFVLPAVLLSGYASPVDNMPAWLATTTEINPLRHFLVIAKGLFLKDMTPAMVWSHTWPLLLIAFSTLSAANWIFRRKFG